MFQVGDEVTWKGKVGKVLAVIPANTSPEKIVRDIKRKDPTSYAANEVIKQFTRSRSWRLTDSYLIGVESGKKIPISLYWPLSATLARVCKSDA